MKTRLAFFIFFFALASCGGQPEVVDVPVEGFNYSEEEYLIGVGDQLDLRVWRNPDLSAKVPVRPDGRISAPLVGDVEAAGLTPETLADLVSEKLGLYIRNPQVTVVVINASSSDYQQRVRITGAVSKPVSLAFRDGMTVLDLVLEAGGPTKFALANKTKLYRKTNGETKVYPIYLDDILKKGRVSTNYPLSPSDILTVPERAL